MTANQRLNSSKSTANRGTQVVAILLTSLTMTLAASAVDRSGERVAKIVAQIQRADYEGDRSALKRLHGELATFVENQDLAARVQYWRGFALWRRAINGFNDNVAPAELQEDLRQALDEFNESAKKDPSFVDAKIGALSCVSLLGYSFRQSQNDPAQLQEFMARAKQLAKEIRAVAPDNPRLLWVMGPNLWYVPQERGGGQAKAIEMYQQGLEATRKHKTTASDPLEPCWGEPELLMNLAWSNLNRTTPDLDAAEQYARSALELVPYWHYVRDILMPQIEEAKRKSERTNPNLPPRETQRHAHRQVDFG
jgi:tetratricopeptide (TPR) repeat protein